MAKREIPEDIQRLLKTICDHFDKEDRAVRERQIRTWRRLKLYWENFQRIYVSETAHDWRIYDEQIAAESFGDMSYYDKPVNVFRAYLESIIAALSVTVPPITCYPDDADNSLDVATAKAGDRIGALIYRHNDAPLLWIHALFILCTEGMIACYTYPKEDEKYGTYKEKKYEDKEEEAYICPNCQMEVPDEVMGQAQLPTDNTQQPNNPIQGNAPQPPQPTQEPKDTPEQFTALESDEFMPDDEDAALHNVIFNEHQTVCPDCGAQLDPGLQKSKFIVSRLTDVTVKAKTRQCIEVYGGLYVKVPNYSCKQPDIPYLKYSYDTHFSNVLDRYDHIDKKTLEKIVGSSGGLYDPYERWGRLNPQYNGEYPLDNITVSNWWLRPSSFNVIPDKKDVARLKKYFPDGAKVVYSNELFCEAENECLDDCWTLTKNPLSDFIHHDPLGTLLVNVQDITNEIISLVLQTMEHGISQTFADPGIVNFDQYKQLETAPGMIIPTKQVKPNQLVSNAFFETRTSTLSAEVLPFLNKIQEIGQLVSGALPSLFGGALEGTKTASEYSMSRAQALQRLQNNWKMLLIWWKEIFSKVIPSYIKEVAEDEKYVQRNESGNFINVFIRKAELEGKIGSIEIEASENLPITWAATRDVIKEFMQSPNQEIMQWITSPENLTQFKQYLGLDEFVIPGEADRIKENEVIQQLVNSEPIMSEDPENPGSGIPLEMPSVPIEQDVDNNQIGMEICRQWLVSEAGRLAKIENQKGYRNVLLRMKMHKAAMMPPPMLPGQPNAAQPPIQGAAPNGGPTSTIQ